MGILNVTPDSFSDGGRYLDVSAAVERGLALVEEGADILDVGGESTRPGAETVSETEELRRVAPVIERLAASTGTPISIDTTKAAVAREALAAGATIINDISALTFDPAMTDVCAASDCGIILMHMQGTPQTMQDAPSYENVVAEIVAYLDERIASLGQSGIARERIVVDPGIGFGKTAQHNLEILSHIAAFHALGRPVLIGHSRKRFLARLLGREIDERTNGTIGVAIAVAQQGAEIIRVHDVAAVKDALTAWWAVTACTMRDNLL
ncbi:MAG: dihydropteroate synthase [Planctomycetaceae bacterium]|nr:dihydropteroate synthase [Planctomycetaceae bacterium]